ncbi:glycosyltransferase [Vibrio fortis]|nr:glycosyltransferase [Vibrio fortis]
MKKNLIDCLDINPSNVFVSFPDSLIDISKIDNGGKINELNFDENKFNLLYPATPIFYKNHVAVLKAMCLIRKSRPDFFNEIVFNITFEKGTYPKFDNIVSELGLGDKVNYLGVVSKNILNSLYDKSNLLVFPSFIETLGLPLLEAAFFNLPIVCSNIDNTKEVLSNYKGAFFVEKNDYQLWSERLSYIYDNSNQIQSRIIENNYAINRPGWDVLFKLLDKV